MDRTRLRWRVNLLLGYKPPTPGAGKIAYLLSIATPAKPVAYLKCFPDPKHLIKCSISFVRPYRWYRALWIIIQIAERYRTSIKYFSISLLIFKVRQCMDQYRERKSDVMAQTLGPIHAHAHEVYYADSEFTYYLSTSPIYLKIYPSSPCIYWFTLNCVCCRLNRSTVKSLYSTSFLPCC